MFRPKKSLIFDRKFDFKAIYRFVGYSLKHRLDFRRSLVSGPRSFPKRDFEGGARAPFPNSGW